MERWKKEENDAKRIYLALKNGCDTAEALNILAGQDSTQRYLIQQAYADMYDVELVESVRSVLGDEPGEALDLWMRDPAERDAIIINRGLATESFNLEAATEIICSRTPSQIKNFKQIYSKKFGVTLEHDIKRQTFGDHKELLLSYLKNQCYEYLDRGREFTAEAAKGLYKARRKFRTDWDSYIGIFSKHSRQTLAATSTYYRDMYDWSLEEAVKECDEGYFKHGLLTILGCAENTANYFAEVLHKAVSGRGTDNTTLIRVIVTRNEIDMQDIKAEYAKKYGRTLNDAVHESTSGHCRTFLLSLLGPNN